MSNLTIIDYLFISASTSIWLVLLMNIILAFSGYMFYVKSLNREEKLIESEMLPYVSILIPAHNEEKVIYKTLRSMAKLNYPKDKFEVIVINDNSSDNTSLEIERVIKEYKNTNIKVIVTNKENGGKGKSSALNIGYESSCGEYICVYDADNNVEKNALLRLISRIHYDDSLGAVIGKFRVRNRDKNILTRFINIETLGFQWMAQAGRWNLLKLCTIPGTNFVVRKSIIEKIGGWDIDAISEDTEVSFRIYRLGYKIAFHPSAVAWEQEPENLKVWFKQRTRWAKGNIYVLLKYLKTILHKNRSLAVFDVIYFFAVYFLFLSSVILSDIVFLTCVFTNASINVGSSFNILWFLSYVLFILEMAITLAMEKGEATIKNILTIALMYFTYSQLWLVVVIFALIEYIKDRIFKREIKWYKTERF